MGERKMHSYPYYVLVNLAASVQMQVVFSSISRGCYINIGAHNNNTQRFVQALLSTILYLATA